MGRALRLGAGADAAGGADPMNRPYLVTVRVDGDPLRTRDHKINAASAYNAGWLYRQLNPGGRIVAIRPVPEGRA